MSTVDVQIVRPKKTGTELVAYGLGTLLGYLLAGVTVTLVARMVGFVPDLGYLESVALVIGVRALLNKPSGYLWWTKEPKV